LGGATRGWGARSGNGTAVAISSLKFG
jgi:hypothetical protein